MSRPHIIHFHGSSKEALERALKEGATLELGEIAVITGGSNKKEEDNKSITLKEND